MDSLNGPQTKKLVLKLKDIREHIHRRLQDAPLTEVTFVNESIINIEKFLNKLSEREKNQNFFTYDTETVFAIQTVKQNLKYVSENRLTKSDFKLKMMVEEYSEILDTMMKKIHSPSGPPKDVTGLDEEKCSDILRSTDIDQRETTGKRTTTAWAFYDIGCGIDLYAESDVSNIFEATKWKSEDFQSFDKKETTLRDYKLETDFFSIKPKDPKDVEHFPKDSSGMITVRVKLPNDLNYQFLQLMAYIQVGQTWNLVDCTLKETSVTFQTIKIDALCVVSNPKVEHVHISPDGCNFVAQTDNRIQLEFSSGTVENEDSLRFHVSPVDKNLLRQQKGILAISDCLYTSGNTPLKKKVKVKVPMNDVRYPNESHKDHVYRLFRQETNGEFTSTDDVVTVNDGIAVYETDKIDGTSVSLIRKDELKKDKQHISDTIEKAHGFKYTCKVVFFVNEVTSSGLTVLLACIEKSKLPEFCHIREKEGFYIYKNGTSRDLDLKPQIRINITLKGCFILPRYLTKKRHDLFFLPKFEDNHTRFVVEIKRKIDQDVYGIFVLTKNHEIIDEICFNTRHIQEYAHGSSLKGKSKPDQKIGLSAKRTTTPREISFSSRTPTLMICHNIEDDFLTEKGLLAVAKLLNADNLFQTVVNLDMKTVQIDQICEKVPTSSRQAFTLLKTALDQHKNNKIDKLQMGAVLTLTKVNLELTC